MMTAESEYNVRHQWLLNNSYKKLGSIEGAKVFNTIL